MKKKLDNIKDLISNRIAVLSSILLFPALLMSLSRSFETGWLNIYFIHITLYLIFIIMAFYRKKLKYSFKIIFISIIYIIIAYAGFIKLSLGGAYFYLILTIALLTILTKRRITLILTALFLVTYSLIAYGFVSGYLVPVVDLNILSKMPSHWITHFISFFSLCVIFIYGFGDFYKELLKTIDSEKSSEKKYRLLFDKANDAITLLKDGVFFDCNEKACEFFVYSKEELIGKSIKEVSPKYQYDNVLSDEKARHFVELTLNGYPQQFEWQHKKSTGELFDLSISLTRIELSDKLYVQGILRDITDKKKKEVELEMHKNKLEELVNEKTKDLEKALEEWKSLSEELADKQLVISKQNIELKDTLKNLKETQSQLVESEKMASLGFLTSGVAHEINNPMNYIMGSYEGLKSYFEKYGSMDESNTDLFLESINEGIQRTTGIVKGLNQFSRINSNYDELCDVHSIIDNCLTILNSKLSENVNVVKEFHNSQITINGNVGKLHQVFINIMKNAVQAIEDSGEITITTNIDNENVNITISDTGCGIKQEHLKQITDPFFTTKPPGEGTGLGLSISKTIINEHGGFINIESNYGVGTKVIIKLPVREL